MLDVTDWKLAPPASDWRLQVSYIIPFAINTLVAMCMGFWLCRYRFMPPWTATPLKYLSLFSVSFWLTVGVYQTGSQAFGLGLGAFGLPPEKAVPGGTTDSQDFFKDINLIVLAVGTMQAGQDFVAYKCLCLVEASGTKELAWKDLHKWAMIDLAYQASSSRSPPPFPLAPIPPRTHQRPVTPPASRRASSLPSSSPSSRTASSACPTGRASSHPSSRRR